MADQTSLPRGIGGGLTFRIVGMAQVLAKLTLYETRLIDAMKDGMREWAAEIQKEMRQHAKWSDRTGHARLALVAYLAPDDAPGDRPSFATAPDPDIDLGKDEYSVVVAGLMAYNQWLETRWSGRYAVIWPTVEANSSEFMRILWDHGKRAT